MNRTTLLSCNQLLDIFSGSHIATAIYTTENLIIEAVTDAMIAFWGKDRSIIGKTLEDAVPELKGQPFIGLLQAVWRTGITEAGTGIPAATMINGSLSTRYYDFEYRALRNDAGEVYCVLHTASDVTERILGQEAIEHDQQQQEIIANEQALNEELASANEELSSINEELKQTQLSLHDLNAELEERVIARTKQLAESEAGMRFMIDDAPVAIGMLTGREMVLESANQYMLKILGKPGSVIGKTFKQAMPELHGQPFFDLLDNVFTSGNNYVGNEVLCYLEQEGLLKEVYANFIYKALKDDNGQTQSILMVANEVTEQVNARKAIEATKHRLLAMVSTTPVAMTILQGRGLVIEQANQSMFAIWQRTGEQVLGKKLIDAFPELEGQPFPKMLADVFETGERVALPEIPVDIVLTDGSLSSLFVNFSYDPIFDQHGKVESILATVIDITETVKNRRQLEESKAELQETTEELAASNEELTAINEEMTASNEELQSTNEELVATQDQLHSIVQQLKESEGRFRFLLNAIPQQVWTAKPDGALNYVNEIICRDFGFDNEEIVGQGWQKFIHPDDLPKALKQWTDSLQSGHEYLVEFRLKLNDGSYCWHLARAIPLIENGQIVLWIGTNTNINLQKVNEQKKDEFLSIASHELKTPLTSIKAFNQLMKRTADAERLTGFVGKSAEHIHRLERLIADLLDVTKLNAGKLEYAMQPFSFKQLLLDSIENVQHITVSHQIILERVDDITFTGDHFRLEQVMNNFLTNAVKYSPQGEKVVVNSKLEDEQIVVSVQDFGIGILPAHIDRLFDRYYRVDNTAMRFEGLGLGLFISSEILKRHQGKFWIESEPGKGSTFYFSIPILTQEQAPTNELSVDLNGDLIST